MFGDRRDGIRRLHVTLRISMPRVRIREYNKQIKYHSNRMRVKRVLYLHPRSMQIQSFRYCPIEETATAAKDDDDDDDDDA